MSAFNLAGWTELDAMNANSLNPANSDLFARLISRIQVTPDGCWEWTGSCDPDGYARISFERKNCKASRVMWLAIHGVIPNLFVLHTCDNPPCINPWHLFLGTNQDNIRDAANKNRLWIQQPDSRAVGVPAINAAKTHCLRGHLLGLRDPSRKQRRCGVCVFIHRKRLDARRKLARAA